LPQITLIALFTLFALTACNNPAPEGPKVSTPTIVCK